MSRLTPSEVTGVLVALAAMLAFSRALGELARRLRQPAVVGELLAGVVLGPTILGRLAPGAVQWLFPQQGGAAIFLDGLVAISGVLFLLAAGLEVDLTRVFRQGRSAMAVSVTGLVVPFALGLGATGLAPTLVGHEAPADPLYYGLFLATSLSITSLPVIVRTLIDLNLFRSDVGVVIVAAAIVQDIIGWIIFAIVLGLLGAGHGHPIGVTVGLTLVFTVGCLTVVRGLIHRALPWLQAHAAWPAGVLAFTLVLALLGAAFTEWVGVHAIFGAFLVGVAIGDSKHLRERTRHTIDQFIGSVFAPIFFTSVGLRVDFLAGFDLRLNLVIFALACASKIVGGGLGARWAGMSRNEALAVGFGMNARGAMQIVLGLLALDIGLISARVFVALVVMAIVTSVLAGPLMQRALGRKRTYDLKAFLAARGFVRDLAGSRDDAIRALVGAVAPGGELSAERLTELVLARERLMPSGLGHGLAAPSSRVAGLKQPLAAIGVSQDGVDFDAPDGEPARIIVLLLLPSDDASAQWGLLEDIAVRFRSGEVRERVEQATTWVELLAALNWGDLAHEAGGERRGVVLAGAGPVARAFARRLVALGVALRVVDTNREHCAVAQREGLTVVNGSALRDVILFQARAHEARTLLAMTPNSEVNVNIATFAREEFDVPEVHALARVDGAPFLDVDEWDRRVAGGEATLVEAVTGPAESAAEALARVSPGAVPVLALRGVGVHLLAPGVGVQPGDRVLGLADVRPTSARDAFARLLARAPLLDVGGRPDVAQVVGRAVAALHRRLAHVPAEVITAALAHRSPTMLTPWFGLIRANVPGAGIFEMVLARLPEGLTLAGGDEGGKTLALVVVVSSADESGSHLQALAGLAHALQRADLEDRWRTAPDVDAARRLLSEA